MALAQGRVHASSRLRVSGFLVSTWGDAAPDRHGGADLGSESQLYSHSLQPPTPAKCHALRTRSVRGTTRCFLAGRMPPYSRLAPRRERARHRPLDLAAHAWDK